MKPTELSVDIFQHIRVVIGIILGLGITRLLNGLARFVQHPSENRPYLTHLGVGIHITTHTDSLLVVGVGVDSNQAMDV